MNLAVGACADPQPVPLYQAPPEDAAPPSDVSIDAAGLDGGTPCDICITTTCAGDCKSDPACWNTILCSIQQNCFQGKSQADVVNCATPCSEEAGIMSSSDPSAQKAYTLLGCALDQCKTQCQFK